MYELHKPLRRSSFMWVESCVNDDNSHFTNNKISMSQCNKYMSLPFFYFKLISTKKIHFCLKSSHIVPLKHLERNLVLSFLYFI